MPKIMPTMTAKAVEALKEGGLHAVGGAPGLFLKIVPPNSRYWVYRYSLRDGQRREMGLGGTFDVSLSDARTRALALRAAVRAGADPVADKRAERAARAKPAQAVTFKDAAEAYVATLEVTWRNDKSGWAGSLENHVYPKIGALPVADVGKPEVLSVLQPIWHVGEGGRLDTAMKLRGRIEKILDYAREADWRPEGPNPATWQGRLDKSLTAPGLLRKKVPRKHHDAIPIDGIGDFMRQLAKVEGMGARCLEFVTLTAVRSGEARGAVWAEIDLDRKVWTIPGERMKAGKEHRVPLSTQAVALLKTMPQLEGTDLVFPSPQSNSKLSDMTLLSVMKRMKANGVPHGMRSTFRDWAFERTNFAREIAEVALAHTNGDKVEAAYRRGDALEKRRLLMQAWADFVDKPSVKDGGNVVPLNAAAG
ncbi:MAG: DUF4102 domain-containing protein [Alphaproteobacteria bacterium]|nr:DUF4102 domain-containing protein [Alphaproteobacteria bacterium]